MGKTETAGLFAQLGIPVYDADRAVHRLYDEGGLAVAPIGEAFPDCIVEGRVDRACLAARVGQDEAAFARLERIVHPLVAREQEVFLDEARNNGDEMVVLDIPLLFETGSETRMDAVVVVSAPREIQRARVLARPGMTEEKLDSILARQLPDMEKRARAHFVVETDKGLEQALGQVRDIVAALKAKLLAAKKGEADA
jgi:dephospho-CoA kinase